MTNVEKMNNIKVLGNIVCWSMHGSVERVVAEEGAAANGIEFDAPRVLEVNAWRRAVKEAVKGGARDTKKFDVVKTRDDDDFIVHEIIERSVEDGASSSIDDKHAEVKHVVSVRFLKNTYLKRSFSNCEELIEAEDWTNPIAAEIRKIYNDQLNTYSVCDIRGRFQLMFQKWAGVRLNDSGGTWFIPAAYVAEVRNWVQWMLAMGYGAFSAIQIDAEDTLAMIESVGRDSIDAQLSDLLSEIETFKNSNIRPSTLENRVESFDALRGKIECYETMLGVAMTSLRTEADAMEVTLIQMAYDAHADRDMAREAKKAERKIKK